MKAEPREILQPRYFNRLAPTPFFGTQLRRQNFNLAPTQYRQLRRLVSPTNYDGITFSLRRIGRLNPNVLFNCKITSCKIYPENNWSHLKDLLKIFFFFPSAFHRRSCIMTQKDPMLLYEIYIISQLLYTPLKLDFLEEMRCSSCLFSRC